MAVPFWSKWGWCSSIDLVEKAFESNQSWVNQMEETWIFWAEKVEWTTEETKEIVKKLWLEKPINSENIEVGKNVPKEVIEHILKHNFVIQNPKFIKCVDWRTPEDKINGIYMPGWTDWLLIAVLKVLTDYNIDIDSNKLRDILVELVGGEENYYYHTDDHSCDVSWACGCGHANLVLNTSKHKASLAPSYAKFLEEKRLENKNKMEVLEWEHNEQGVLLLDIEWVSIVPKWINTSFFVYNQKEIQKILKEFVDKINNSGALRYTNFKGNLQSLYIDLNTALKELDEEALSTFGILGGEAPHYRINEKDWKYIVEYDWLVKNVVANYYIWE